jgi:hypothetical protein
MRPQPNSSWASDGARPASAAAAAQARTQAKTKAWRSASRRAVWVPAAGGAANARAMPGNASDATSWIASTSGSSTSFQA